MKRLCFPGMVLSALLVCCLPARPARAASPAEAPESATERVLGFHSEITVRRDGGIEVREIIRVRCSGLQIKRGIYRDFPTLYRGPLFTRRAVPFEVVEVLRDGRKEAWHTAELSNGPWIYFGSADVLLKPGTYTYTFSYRTGRQMGFFADHDELYWNATGNGWVFDIENASARVTLPEGVPGGQVRLEAYTGPQGTKGQDFASHLDAAGRACFSTTRRLPAGSGLTIVVSLPKGFVAEPSAGQKLRWLLGDNVGLGVGLLGALAVLAYYLVAWVRVGRDPARGTIIPLFEPPKGISPAGARYLRRMGCDNKCLAAATINAAVRGCLTLEQQDDRYTLRSTGSDSSGLAPEERLMVEEAGGDGPGRGALVLDRENHQQIREVIKRFERRLAGGFGKDYFVRNGLYVIPGAVVSALFFLAAGWTFSGSGGEIAAFTFMTVWLSGWTAGVTILLHQVARQWKRVLTFRKAGGVSAVLGFAGNLGGAMVITAFSVPFVGGEVFGLVMLAKTSSILAVPMVLLLALINAIFYQLLKAYTPRGRRLMDEIEGFRMYLAAAEGRDLDLVRAPARTPELFERYLPYALALDVENRWAEQFADVLAGAADSPGAHPERSPAWYSGAAWSTLGAADFASSLGGSLSGAISSSSTAPGSSSGGGGGGSSGGGGGGGGGGGW
jgi:uncharacterized membrane protein YgcG